jgi:hypothetical protein
VTTIANAASTAAGLRKLADMIEKTPAMADVLGWGIANVYIPLPATASDPASVLNDVVTAADGFATVANYGDGARKFYGVDVTFSPFVSLHVYAERTQSAVTAEAGK